MKKNRKSSKVLFLAAFMAMAIIAIAGINMRTLINSDGLIGTARKAGANDAVADDVLENHTFTSDTAGICQDGTIKDYSEYEGRFKLLAATPPESKMFNIALNPGYYTNVNIDATDVYNEGHDDGFDEGYDEGFAYALSNLYINVNVPTYSGSRYWATFALEKDKGAKSMTITNIEYTSGAYASGDIFRFYVFDPNNLSNTDYIDVSLENLSLPYTVAVTNKKISSINLGSFGTSEQQKYIQVTFNCNY